MSSYFRSHWRDIDAWKKEGFVFSTPSNDAVKLYDAAVSQIIQYHENESLGGLEKTINSIIEADPNFVMGHLLKSGMPLIRVDLDANPEIKKDYDFIVDLSENNNLTERDLEHKYVLAYKECFHGNLEEACIYWEDILTEHPTDIYAIQLLQEACILNGKYRELLGTIASVFPSWKPDIPLQPYLYGKYAFALEENKLYTDAERFVVKGLELMPVDVWATHTRAHIFDETDRIDEGILFMNKTVDNWKINNPLTAHNYWHLALYHMEKGEFETVLDLFDDEVGGKALSSSISNLANAASLLYRLELEGVNVGDRWDRMLTRYAACFDERVWMAGDAHLLMLALGAKREDLTLKLMQSLRDYAKSGCGTNAKYTRDLGIALCDAFILADKGKFDEAVELLKPLRNQLYKLGGSNTMQDVFRLFLINAALMSPRKDHQKFARRLMTERQGLKEKSCMTDRMAARIMANHAA